MAAQQALDQQALLPLGPMAHHGKNKELPDPAFTFMASVRQNNDGFVVLRMPSG